MDLIRTYSPDTEVEAEIINIDGVLRDGTTPTCVGSGTTIDLHLDLQTRYVFRNDDVTENPLVTGDVSASYNGELQRNEVSSWKDLDGFSLNDNNLQHRIDQYGEAEYQVQYEYVTTPDVVQTIQVHSSNRVLNLPFADINDDAIEYDVIRTKIDGQTLTADLVPVSHDAALPVHVQTPNEGVLAWREI